MQGVPREKQTAWIPGAIVPKQRARLGRGGHTFTPQETVDFEEKVKMLGKLAFISCGKKPVKVNIQVRYQKDDLKDASDFPVDASRGDLDNVLKSVLDALQHVAYDNDRQVVSIVIDKRWCLPGEDQGVSVAAWPAVVQKEGRS